MVCQRQFHEVIICNIDIINIDNTVQVFISVFSVRHFGRLFIVSYLTEKRLTFISFYIIQAEYGSRKMGSYFIHEKTTLHIIILTYIVCWLLEN